jgi:hypothetical protein
VRLFLPLVVFLVLCADLNCRIGRQLFCYFFLLGCWPVDGFFYLVIFSRLLSSAWPKWILLHDLQALLVFDLASVADFTYADPNCAILENSAYVVYSLEVPCPQSWFESRVWFDYPSVLSVSVNVASFVGEGNSEVRFAAMELCIFDTLVLPMRFALFFSQIGLLESVTLFRKIFHVLLVTHNDQHSCCNLLQTMMDGSLDQMWSSFFPCHSSLGVISSRLVWGVCYSNIVQASSNSIMYAIYSVVKSQKMYCVFWKVWIHASICTLQYLKADSACVYRCGLLQMLRGRAFLDSRSLLLLCRLVLNSTNFQCMLSQVVMKCTEL